MHAIRVWGTSRIRHVADGSSRRRVRDETILAESHVNHHVCATRDNLRANACVRVASRLIYVIIERKLLHLHTIVAR